MSLDEKTERGVMTEEEEKRNRSGERDEEKEEMWTKEGTNQTEM